MALIIDGKALANTIYLELKKQVEDLASRYERRPGLATILVGDDPGSAIYVRNKIKACKESGYETFDYVMPATTTQKDLISLLEKLKTEARVHGILVQLPLPQHVSTEAVLTAIPEDKDVDGFGVTNWGRFYQAKRLTELGSVFVPCTPLGVLKMLESIGFELSGRLACVLGRSNIVGKPMAHLLTLSNATVVLCHSKTKNLPQLAAQADLIVSAMGKPYYVTAAMVKPGACVIDVGINRLPDIGLVGDCDFKALQTIAGYLTPVPGGVGPMTIAMLLSNTLKAFKRQIGAADAFPNFLTAA